MSTQGVEEAPGTVLNVGYAPVGETRRNKCGHLTIVGVLVVKRWFDGVTVVLVGGDELLIGILKKAFQPLPVL
jgi:hypothetical protein